MRASLSEEAERKMNDITQDMANKENNRSIIIQGVKDSCQHEVRKIGNSLDFLQYTNCINSCITLA